MYMRYTLRFVCHVHHRTTKKKNSTQAVNNSRDSPKLTSEVENRNLEAFYVLVIKCSKEILVCFLFLST